MSVRNSFRNINWALEPWFSSFLISLSLHGYIGIEFMLNYLGIERTDAVYVIEIRCGIRFDIFILVPMG